MEEITKTDIINEKKPEKNAEHTGGILQKAALIIWAALIVLVFIKRDSISVESILAYSPSNLWAAFAVMMGLFALKTLSIVFYSGALFTASGMLFGMPAAIAVNIAGALVMLLEGYALGRAGGQRLVEDLSGKYPRFAEFTGLKDTRPFSFALLIRMLKFVNYDIGSMFMGASGVSLLPYLGGSLIGLLPEAVLFALAGSGISNMDAVPAAAAAVIYAVMTITSAAILKYMISHSRN